MTTTLFLFPFFFFFRVTKFGMLLILTEKSGFIQQQSCFSSLLARNIDKIPVWGPYAILAGPDGFFRTCSRHHVRPSYGDFLNSFAMKARAGPYGSYNKRLNEMRKSKADQTLEGTSILFNFCIYSKLNVFSSVWRTLIDLTNQRSAFPKFQTKS